MENDAAAVPDDGLTTKDRHRNRFMFGLGTLGRDMVYTLVSMYLMFYLTDILKISNTELIAVTVIMIVFRVFDALNDPIMGTVVDNTRTKWGKYKPWMTLGMFTAGAVAVLLFTDFGLKGAGFIALFAVLYLLWGIFFTTNDTSYWGMMPSLSEDQKDREKIGSVARICANIGLFSVVALITPITAALGDLLGSATAGYTLYAAILVGIMWLMQLFTLIGVKEPKLAAVQPRTGLKDMFRALFKNDQLMVIALSMALFMIGYCTTTSFGQYYFKYVYGDEGMYSVFAVILGVSQITALVVFPFLTKKFKRKTLFISGVVGVAVGYIMFFFMPANMIGIGVSGVFIFVGQAFIQLLMLVFLADTVEYGEYKLGRRNESLSFSVQSFINKLGGAVGSGIVGMTIALTGINDAETPADVTDGALWVLKVFMLLVPMVIICGAFVLYFFKFRLDEKRYAEILSELKTRRALSADGKPSGEPIDGNDATEVAEDTDTQGDNAESAEAENESTDGDENESAKDGAKDETKNE